MAASVLGGPDVRASTRIVSRSTDIARQAIARGASRRVRRPLDVVFCLVPVVVWRPAAASETRRPLPVVTAPWTLAVRGKRVPARAAGSEERLRQRPLARPAIRRGRAPGALRTANPFRRPPFVEVELLEVEPLRPNIVFQQFEHLSISLPIRLPRIGGPVDSWPCPPNRTHDAFRAVFRHVQVCAQIAVQQAETVGRARHPSDVPAAHVGDRWCRLIAKR